MNRTIVVNMLMTAVVITANLWTLSMPNISFIVQVFCLSLIAASVATTYRIILNEKEISKIHAEMNRTRENIKKYNRRHKNE